MTSLADSAPAAAEPADERSPVVEPRRRRGLIESVIVSMRPPEWVKNTFVLVPVVFAGRVDVASAVIHTIEAFFAFCLVAGGGYLFNDVRDVELDRKHPRKHRRPLASGDLSPRAALTAAGLAYVGGFALAALAGWKVLGLTALYLAITISYSTVLKHLVIIDVMAIAAGFIVRVQAGLVAADAPGSDLLLLTTGMLALLLGLTKRRQEVASEVHNGQHSRPVLEHYSLPFLDQMVALSAAGTLMAYVINATNSKFVGGQVLPTVGPVVYGILRYLYLIYDRRDPRSTASLLATDPGIIGAGIVWIVMAGVLVYT